MVYVTCSFACTVVAEHKQHYQLRLDELVEQAAFSTVRQNRSRFLVQVRMGWRIAGTLGWPACRTATARR